MTITTTWKPDEIIVHNEVENDPITTGILNQCQNVPTRYISSIEANDVVRASYILRNPGSGMLEKITAGKRVMFIAPATDLVDEFTISDDRLMCPHFELLKLASNGCYYKCDWCFLKLTYRAQRPFITVRVQYDEIKMQILKRLKNVTAPIMFNTGELADSLSMEHLTEAARTFIPWFGGLDKGYLFMLTKSDHVDDILNLPHNGHTLIAWSMNNDLVSRKFEIGAPSFNRRLEAAYKVQQAGYPLRIRIDPIVPFEGWQAAYKDTVRRIFQRILPARVTLGTLRFEEGFYNMRHSIFTTRSDLSEMMKGMLPMFEQKVFSKSKRPKVGKYSFTEERRVEIFNFMIREIRKYSACPVALCKESASVWDRLGLDLSRCQCVCQFDYADMTT